MAKYVDVAKQRISEGIRKYTKIIEQAQKRGVNEADTRDIVKAILGDVLGYDPFFEVTGEYSVKGQYADFGVKLGDQIRFFVEVKSIGTKLEDKQMFQIIGYAANQGHDWGILTNGDTWNIYRLFAGADKGTELVASISLTDGQLPPREKVERFFMVSKEGFRQNALAEHWSRVQVLNPLRIAEKLCEEKVLKAIRTEVQRGAGFEVSMETICSVMLNQVIRGDLSDKIKASLAKAKPKPEKKPRLQPTGL
jgi:predicted type IV restriction endonuclease